MARRSTHANGDEAAAEAADDEDDNASEDDNVIEGELGWLPPNVAVALLGCVVVRK